MNLFLSHPFIFHLLGWAVMLSGAAAVSCKAPIYSLLAAGIQWLALAAAISVKGYWQLGLGFFVLFGLLYLRSLQFFRAMGVTSTKTQHRLRYSQIIGLLGGVLLGLFVALQLLQANQLHFIYGWLTFAIGLTGILARRNSFVFLICLQMMFNAALLIWVQKRSSDTASLLALDFVFLVALSAYWFMGWAFFVNRLLAKRPLDLDAAHLLKS